MGADGAVVEGGYGQGLQIGINGYSSQMKSASAAHKPTNIAHESPSVFPF